MLINGVPYSCITQASAQYHVPATVIVSVLEVENGQVGDANVNSNGTIDYGPMQINSVWLKRLEPFNYTAHDLQYDPCINVNVGTWILAQKIAANKSVWKGIGDYHSKTTEQNLLYQYKVNVYYDAIDKAYTEAEKNY